MLNLKPVRPYFPKRRIRLREELAQHLDQHGLRTFVVHLAERESSERPISRLARFAAGKASAGP